MLGLFRVFAESFGFSSCFFGLSGLFITVSTFATGKRGEKELLCVERNWSEGLESSRDLKRDLNTFPRRLD